MIEPKTKTVEFRDGSKLTVSEQTWDIVMRLNELEVWAQANQLDDPKKQLFREAFYPKLAACASGDVPDEETARALPSAELDLWWSAVREVNPEWFTKLDELTQKGASILDGQRKKKPKKSPTKSSTG